MSDMNMIEPFEVSVWDIETGDIIEKEWDCDEDRLNELEAEYMHDGLYDVCIDKRWESYAEDYED